MRTARPNRGSHRLLAAAGTAALLAAALTACGSGSGGSAGSSGSAAAKGGSGSSLPSDVAALTKPLASYPVPTQAVANAKSLAGKTIYYIPISQQAPQFTITAKTLTAAAAKVGVKVQICDGKGTPTDISACIGQGTQAQAAAIIVDAIPYVLAANALDAAQKAKIPVIIGNNIPDSAHPASKTLAYVGENAGAAMETALAKWVIADSDGKADILINGDTDGPSPVSWLAQGTKVYSDSCSGCKVTTNKVSSSNFSLVGSSTSSALLKNPSIDYVESQYEQFLQPTQTGIQQTSRTGIKVIDGAAQLSSVQAVKNGSLAVAAGQASAYEGWVYMDAVLRMATGQTLPTYTIPVRLFTKDTLAGTDVSETGQDSGSWFGPTRFTDQFAKLWGVA